jgi:hypothetical protein
MSIQRLIDGIPSEGFYSSLHYTKILELLGAGEFAVPGSKVRCPSCKTSSMTVFELEPLDGWMHCAKCGLAGDGLRLYGAAYGIANPEELVDRVRCDLRVTSITPEDISAYCRTYDFLYNRVGKVWEKAQAAMKGQANRMASGRLHELNLWLSQDVFDRGLSKWIGFTFRSEVEDLLCCKIPGISKKQEGLLTIPFHLRPGLIAGFGFIGNADNLSYVNVLQGHEAGLCGLPTSVDAKDIKAYLVPHPMHAIRIAHKCAVERYDRVCVMAKSPMGQLDPAVLASMDQVVWIDQPDTQLLKACAKERNFKVMELDTPYIWRPSEKLSRLWEGSLMPKIHRAMDEAPKHGPVDFLASKLLGMGMVAARNEVLAMDLSQFERNLLLATCQNELRDAMEDIVSSTPIGSQPVMLDKRIIIERDGGLWAQGSREVSDEQVCNVVVRIRHICRSHTSGEASVFGTLIMDGTEVQFQMPEARLRDEPAKTLAFIAVQANLPKQPFLADSMARKYFDLIVRLSSPQVHSVQEHVGFDASGIKFNLPRMAISPENIKVGVPFVMSNGALPASDFEIDPAAKISSISGIFSPGPENACYLAAMGSVLAGCYSLKQEPRGTSTMLVGEKGDLAEYIFDLIRMDLHLDPFVLQNKKDVDEALKMAADHHLPVAIDGLRSPPRLLSEWLEGAGRNSFVLASPLIASCLGDDHDWNFVRANIPYSAEGKGLLNSELFFPFAMQYSLTIGGGPAKQILESMKYMCESLKGDSACLNQAAALLSSRGMINAKSPAVQLINFINEGVEAGLFKTFTGDVSKKRHVVMRSAIEDAVSIDLTALLSQMRFYHMPVRMWTSSVDHLKVLGAEEVPYDGGTMLKIKKPLWNSLVTVVKRMKTLRRCALSDLVSSAQR